jgi:hypothetical protein
MPNPCLSRLAYLRANGAEQVEHEGTVMKTLVTTLVAAAALGGASLASISPAQAQYWGRCWGGCGGAVAAGVVGGSILGLGVGSALAAPPYQGPGTLAPYQYGPAPYGPAPYYAGPPPVAYACHYVRVRDYDAYGRPIIVRQRVCD